MQKKGGEREGRDGYPLSQAATTSSKKSTKHKSKTPQKGGPSCTLHGGSSSLSLSLSRSLLTDPNFQRQPKDGPEGDRPRASLREALPLRRLPPRATPTVDDSKASAPGAGAGAPTRPPTPSSSLSSPPPSASAAHSVHTRTPSPPAKLASTTGGLQLRQGSVGDCFPRHQQVQVSSARGGVCILENLSRWQFLLPPEPRLCLDHLVEADPS